MLVLEQRLSWSSLAACWKRSVRVCEPRHRTHCDAFDCPALERPRREESPIRHASDSCSDEAALHHGETVKTWHTWSAASSARASSIVKHHGERLCKDITLEPVGKSLARVLPPPQTSNRTILYASVNSRTLQSFREPYYTFARLRMMHTYTVSAQISYTGAEPLFA